MHAVSPEHSGPLDITLYVSRLRLTGYKHEIGEFGQSPDISGVVLQARRRVYDNQVELSALHDRSNGLGAALERDRSAFDSGRSLGATLMPFGQRPLEVQVDHGNSKTSMCRNDGDISDGSRLG